MAVHPLDATLQAVTPTLMVPRFGTFEPLAINGHRFLVADDGLWIEVRRPWLYVLHRLAAQEQVAMPYGKLKQTIDIRRIPRRLLEDFISMAREEYPVECAAWITWQEDRDEWQLMPLAPSSAGHSHVNFARPILEEGEHLVLDIHSHGAHPAFFSSTDDDDDREFKVAGVVGQVATELQTKFRLCINGAFIDIPNME